MVALALAMMTASPVTRAISSGVTTGDEAKPHAPLTITRTPKPKLESSVTFGTASVLPVPRSGDKRSPMRWSLMRTMRISAYVALNFLASRQRDGAELFQLGVGCFGVFRRGEQSGGQGSGRGRKKMTASQHLGIVADASNRALLTTEISLPCMWNWGERGLYFQTLFSYSRRVKNCHALRLFEVLNRQT